MSQNDRSNNYDKTLNIKQKLLNIIIKVFVVLFRYIRALIVIEIGIIGLKIGDKTSNKAHNFQKSNMYFTFKITTNLLKTIEVLKVFLHL